MYFPHAFKKAFLPVVSGGTLTPVTTGKTDALTAGQIGLFDSKTYTAIAAAPASGNQTFIIAQGSYFTSDKIGPFHGGYKESVKSKVINPKYVSRFFKVAAKTPQNQIVTVSVSNVYEDETVRLRLDIKGSPALRFLSHNLYKTLDAFTGCAADSANPVLVDPTAVVAKFAKQVNEDPILSKVVVASAKDSTGAAVADLSNPTLVTTGITSATDADLILTVAYADTKFGDCTFTVTDHYELEPLFVHASLVDESGQPCSDRAVAVVTETQAPVQASGVGETVIRDLILDGRYRQEAYHDGSSMNALRMREIEANPGLANINRSGLYDQVCLLHNVPRLMNPSSTFDNDQYLLVFHVPAGTNTTALTNLIQSFLDLAGNGVALESF